MGVGYIFVDLLYDMNEIGIVKACTMLIGRRYYAYWPNTFIVTAIFCPPRKQATYIEHVGYPANHLLNAACSTAAPFHLVYK